MSSKETTANNEKLAQLPLSSLFRSPLNVRTKRGTNLAELAASMLAHGVLQNLVVTPELKKRKPTGRYGVVAGGRRLDALTRLHGEGKIPEAYPVACKIIGEREAVELSLAENCGREALHPIDQFQAFKALVDGGKSVEDVAAAFGATPLTVKRRLKLANVAPRFLDLYRNDEITLEHLMALALTDDHARQEEVWDSLEGYACQPWRIRQLLTEQEIDVLRDPMARFVGVDAYEAAGGIVRRDLFSDADEGGFMTDKALLERLAQEKLTSAAATVQGEGWAWVEVRPRVDFAELSAYGRVEPERREPTPEEQERLEAIGKEMNELQEKIDNGEISEDDDEALARFDALEAEHEAIGEGLLVASEEDHSLAGALVTIDSSGSLHVRRGLIRPGDKVSASSQAGEGANVERKKPIHSERLTRQLTAHRTAAMQASLVNSADVAIATLAARLAAQVFYPLSSLRWENVTQIRIETPDLAKDAPDFAESPAASALNGARERWQARLPVKAEFLFGWMLEQPQETVFELLAFCTATTINAVYPRDWTTEAADQLAQALDLDMAQWWKPTKESYLAHVPKSRIVSAVAEVAPEKAARLATMKKDALIEAAERHLGGSGWLPEPLRGMCAPDASQEGIGAA
ncbi:MAG: ParB/RepB/Spo0J family partition protein [Betaproteobacteria bacterium]|nr:ParB/RepB/Spo0J family partition protein [Betaproteobacteria bacterium]